MKKLFASAFSATLILFSSSAFAAEFPSTPVPEAPKPPQGIISNRLISEAPLPSDFVLGNKDAKVVVIEYASLSCPHCAHFSATIMPEIQKKYIDTGKIRYVLRQFPLNEPAFRAAILVNCIGEQQGADKYYLFNRVLFDSQSKWAFDGNWLSGLETIAAVGGVSKEQFQSCMNNKERETQALKDKKETMDELKVPHTPYFFIGGEAYNNDITLADMSKFIDAKLAKAN
jgi:protein-disulfide isomerase